MRFNLPQEVSGSRMQYMLMTLSCTSAPSANDVSGTEYEYMMYALQYMMYAAT